MSLSKKLRYFIPALILAFALAASAFAGLANSPRSAYAAQENYTLYYNTQDGLLHKGSLTGDVFPSTNGATYSGEGTTLTLAGFNFITSANIGLEFSGTSEITLILAEDTENMFQISNHPAYPTSAIRHANGTLNIVGENAKLYAYNFLESANAAYGIYADKLTLDGGETNAYGGQYSFYTNKGIFVADGFKLSGATSGLTSGETKVLASSLEFNAVQIKYPEATHNFSSAWSSDATDHWHACTDAGCNKVSDKAAHVPGAPATATTDQTCSVCAYVLTLKTMPVITNANAVYSTQTNATISFESDRNGSYAIVAVTKGSPAPAKPTSGWTECEKGSVSQTLTGLDGGDKDVYIFLASSGSSTANVKVELTYSHNFAATWTTDSDYHWRACTDSGCTAVKDKAAHAGSPATENTDQVCTICGYVMALKTVPSIASPAARFDTDTTSTVTFVSDRAGEYAVVAVPKGDPAPSEPTSGWKPCQKGEVSATLADLTCENLDVYIFLKSEGSQTAQAKVTLSVAPKSNGGGMSAGGIVGLVIGILLLLLLLLYISGYFFLYRKHKLDDKKIRVIYCFLPKGAQEDAAVSPEETGDNQSDDKN